jgi:hypothetical protein
MSRPASTCSSLSNTAAPGCDQQADRSYLGLGVQAVAGSLAVHGPGLTGAARYYGAALIVLAVLAVVGAERKERKRS